MDDKDYKRTVYIDMDGVIADFDGGFQSIAGISTDNVQDVELWQRISDYGKSKFFSELPWMPGGQELWTFVNENFLSVKVLTALGKSDAIDGQTSEGKRMWLHKNIPSLRDSNIIMVRNKHLKRHYSRPGDIIIDDTESTIIEWDKKGGIGIFYKTADETINELKKYV